MAKLEIVDDCLAPERHIWLAYSGPNPWSVAEKISKSLEPLLHISGANTGNSRLNWDALGDYYSFYAIWWARKKFSKYSEMWVDIRIVGKEHKTTKEGEFTLRVRAELKTEFETFNIILKPLWYLYSYIFYDRARRRFIEQCRELIHTFRNEIKEHYDLQITEAPISVAMG
ncbi:MAG: hypothetical protein QW703_00510 [Candidatus Aenigmatarchaeota archaeon]